MGDKTGLYWKIKALAQELGFADFGIAPAGEVSEISRNNYLHALEKGYFADMGYLHKNIEKRFDPCLMVEGAASVMVFLAPYSLPDSITPPQGVSNYALGKDYHKTIKDKLFILMRMLKDIHPDFAGRAFVDSAPVLERDWGVKAGLGFVGKNNFLISRSCGIKNFIGCIICNLTIPATRDMEPEKVQGNAGGCGECTRCLDACPTGALCNPYKMDARKCISYHTIENRNLKEDIANNVVPDMDGKYFGCDSCADACPWNSRNIPGWEEFHTNYTILEKADFSWWHTISEMEFKEIFTDSPLLRGGLENIQTSLEWGKKCKRNG